MKDGSLNKLGIKDDFKNWLNNIQDEKTLGDNYLTINKLSDITRNNNF